MNELKERIKQHEGYREEVYIDTLGFKTGGYGHKILPGEYIPKDKAGWEAVFDEDFDQAYEGATNLVGHMELHDTAYEVVVEMCYQMGEMGVSKFKKMLQCLEIKDHLGASQEMLSSRWAQQTPERAESLSDILMCVDD